MEPRDPRMPRTSGSRLVCRPSAAIATELIPTVYASPGLREAGKCSRKKAAAARR